jgi:hypothetical protein
MELHSLLNWDPAAPVVVDQVDLNYELTDHLGNVCTVVTGRLLDGNGGGTLKQAELVSAQGYEPFGSLLPGRNYSSGSYRFSFNGQETDDEIFGSPGTSTSAEFWQYDTRTGRRWDIDPVHKPWQSSYSAFSGNPIRMIDPNGDDDFFDRNGKYLGRTWTGNQIRIVSADMPLVRVLQDVANNSRVITTLPFCPDDQASLDALTSIAQFYAPFAGFVTNSIELLWVNENGENGSGAAYYRRKTDALGLFLNEATGKLNPAMDDVNNMINAFSHERNHQEDPSTSEDLFHVNAIIAQSNHSSWSGTTWGFKQNAGSYAARLLNRALTDKVSVEDVMKQIESFNNSRASEASYLTFDESTQTVESVGLMPELNVKP